MLGEFFMYLMDRTDSYPQLVENVDNTLKSLFLLSLFYQQILFISKFFKRILQIIHNIVENLLQIH